MSTEAESLHEPYKVVIQALAEIGLQSELDHFFQKLKTDDDWSTVIKLHALLEALYSSLLTDMCCKNRELESCFSELQAGGRKCGKIAFLQALGVLNKAQTECAHRLADLRNAFAHNASKVTISLKQHLEGSQKAGKEKDFIQTVLIMNGPNKEKLRTHCENHPMDAVLIGAMQLCKQISDRRLSML